MYEDDAPQDWGSPEDPPVTIGLRLLFSVAERMEFVTVAGSEPGLEQCLSCGSSRVSGHTRHCQLGRALSMGPTRDVLLGTVWDAQFLTASSRHSLMTLMHDFTAGFNRLEGLVTHLQGLLPKG